MVQVVELRILHPYSVEDFQRGQHYGNLKTAEQMSDGNSQGSVLMSSTPYYDEIYGEGAFNHSITKLGEGNLPAWALRIIPASALVVDEQSWTLFPYCRTLVTVPFFTKLRVECISIALDDAGTTDNALRLSKEHLAARKVEYIDIGAAKMDPKDYRPDSDPALVKSELTGKGPLTPGWQEREKPIMCQYKVIIAEFSYFGLASRVEGLLVDMMRKLFTITHRNMYSTLDQWWPLSLDKVLDMLDATRRAQGAQVDEVRASSSSSPALIPPLEPDSGSDTTGTESDAGEAGDDDDEDDFFDAETDLALVERQQSLSRTSGDMAAAAAASPVTPCPHCMAKGDDTRCSANPALCGLFCVTCSESFCDKCFNETHITAKMKQHETVPLSPMAISMSGSISLSASGPVTYVLPQSVTLRRNQTRAPPTLHTALPPAISEGEEGEEEEVTEGGAEGPQGGAAAAAAAAAGVDGEGDGPVQVGWDKVRHPPLNVYVAPEEKQQVLAKKAGAPLGALWHSILEGSAAEEDEVFIETPEPLRAAGSELAGAMVELIAAIYRSVVSETAESSADSSPFPLLPFFPVSSNVPSLYPSHGTPTVAAWTSEPAGLVQDPYNTANNAATDEFGVLVGVKKLPAASPDPSLEAQRAEIARMFRSLSEDLLELDPRLLSGPEAQAFWINIYNALILHGYLIYGIPTDMTGFSYFYQRASYLIGNLRFSAASIYEVILLKGHKSSQNWAKGVFGFLFSENNPAGNFAAAKYDPRITFLLAHGHYSSPPVRRVHAAKLEEQLEHAETEYLRATVTVKKYNVKGNRVCLPELVYVIRKEFGEGKEEQLRAIQSRLAPAKAKAIGAAAASSWTKNVKLWSVDKYEWAFRYLFAAK